jgi:hypothetical protein
MYGWALQRLLHSLPPQDAIYHSVVNNLHSCLSVCEDTLKSEAEADGMINDRGEREHTPVEIETA